MNPSRHKSLQSHPCAFESWSILHHQLSCHTALEMVLLHQAKLSTHCQLRNHLDNSVLGAIYELNTWGYKSLRVLTLLSVMKITITGVITFRPARSKVGIHITCMTRLTPRAQSQRKLLTVDLYSLEIKKWAIRPVFRWILIFLFWLEKIKRTVFKVGSFLWLYRVHLSFGSNLSWNKIFQSFEK